MDNISVVPFQGEPLVDAKNETITNVYTVGEPDTKNNIVFYFQFDEDEFIINKKENADSVEIKLFP